jgi:hypothetical protein
LIQIKVNQEHINDDEMVSENFKMTINQRESQQLFYEDNGQSDDIISNTLMDNKQEIDRILCSTKYDSQTKFRLL